ncbi:uncharacterized protein LOC124158854 [Ischnura elegans]|uniref:uncharacterized protein LOC124158854 n=1 Tax=Ischnura elegans TaxID=197161 RepID=UPI001ED876A7|nr:uncharacterized protein LOC124158854 [Ischnura elegans]
MSDHHGREDASSADAPSLEDTIRDRGEGSGGFSARSEQSETRKTFIDGPSESMDEGSMKTEQEEKTRTEQDDLDSDGIGKIKKVSKHGSKPIGNIDDVLSEVLGGSKSGLSGCDAPALCPDGGDSARSQASVSAMTDPPGRVRAYNFGRVELTGTTDDIVVGDKTEYLNSVTVQQIVHQDEEGMLQAAGDSAVRRRRVLSSSGEPSPKAARRTGMVLRDDGSAAGDGAGDDGVKAGNGLLFRHLLGRKVETAAWIPIALLSCITFICITIYGMIFGHFQPRREAAIPSVLCKPTEYAECPQIPSKKIPEALPKLQRTMIIPRSMWQAKRPLDTILWNMKHPVEYVIISHTAAEQQYDLAGCLEQVRIIQKFHVESRGWSDIGYNFLVGGDGNAYEGRGWEYVGAHAKGYNAVSIGISFIGTFIDVLPPPAQIRACKLLIKEGVIQNKISKNYKLIAHRQVSPTESPGEKLYEELQNWEHWSPEV